MIDTAVSSGCDRESLEEKALTSIEKLCAGGQYASKTLQIQDPTTGRQKLESQSVDEPYLGASSGPVGHEIRGQCGTVACAGYGGTHGVSGDMRGNHPDHEFQTGYFDRGDHPLGLPDGNGYSCRGRGNGNRLPQGQSHPGPSTAPLTFACQFYRHDEGDHQNCLNSTLRRISDVRQHIKRRHTQPSYCPRCGVTFHNDTAYNQRDAHLSSCRSNINPPAPPGMTPEQCRDMGNAATRRRGVNDEQRWYEIWDIMFPGQARPQSPYIDIVFERRRVEARTALAQYLQSTRLHDFIQQNLNGIGLYYSLRLLLEDFVQFSTTTASSNYDQTIEDDDDVDAE
ncbi:hypothetical protein F5Y09DRAFT_312864 [Xylaria sp. FL1042]|nr:hypothetical protein F5Y09DRAFT_312864 [Xylaria sp. FL1042]